VFTPERARLRFDEIAVAPAVSTSRFDHRIEHTGRLCADLCPDLRRSRRRGEGSVPVHARQRDGSGLEVGPNGRDRRGVAVAQDASDRQRNRHQGNQGEGNDDQQAEAQ
jgi:hypothetical protein